MNVGNREGRWVLSGSGVPDEAVDPSQSFVRLKESLGSLLLCWSRLEDAVADALRRMRAPPPGKTASFGDRVTALTSELDAAARAGPPCTPDGPDLVRRIDEARRMRNLIVHRLTGVCAEAGTSTPKCAATSAAALRTV